MRLWILLITAGALGITGCTHMALERRTVGQASTLSELQYHQVLDNIAMFACDPDAMAWHLKLSGATIQVADQGTGGITNVSQGGLADIFTWTLGAQRGVVSQWSGIPTVEADNLAALQLAYQKAVNPLDPDGRLRTAFFDRIVKTAVQYNVVLSRETLDKAIDCNDRLDEVKQYELKRKNAELHDQLEKIFDYLARLSRPFTDAQVDNYAQRLFNKITEETRGEARAKLQVQQEQQRVNVSQTRIADLPYIPRYPATGRAEHNLHDTEQAQKQIKVLLDLAEAPEFAGPWVVLAKCHHELPKCACECGHYCKCGHHCWAAVAPQDRATLRDFTLAILTLAPISVQESTPGFAPGSVTYSPTIGGGLR
jgi:hypothetical protein